MARVDTSIKSVTRVFPDPETTDNSTVANAKMMMEQLMIGIMESDSFTSPASFVNMDRATDGSIQFSTTMKIDETMLTNIKRLISLLINSVPPCPIRLLTKVWVACAIPINGTIKMEYALRTTFEIANGRSPKPSIIKKNVSHEANETTC